MNNEKFAIYYLTKNYHKMVEDNNNYAIQSVKLAISALEKQALKEMAIQELIEKYKLERKEHIIECSKGDASRLKNELAANKLTQVIEDLEEVMK